MLHASLNEDDDDAVRLESTKSDDRCDTARGKSSQLNTVIYFPLNQSGNRDSYDFTV